MNRVRLGLSDNTGMIIALAIRFESHLIPAEPALGSGMSADRPILQSGNVEFLD